MIWWFGLSFGSGCFSSYYPLYIQKRYWTFLLRKHGLSLTTSNTDKSNQLFLSSLLYIHHINASAKSANKADDFRNSISLSSVFASTTTPARGNISTKPHHRTEQTAVHYEGTRRGCVTLINYPRKLLGTADTLPSLKQIRKGVKTKKSVDLPSICFYVDRRAILVMVHHKIFIGNRNLNTFGNRALVVDELSNN